MTARTRWTVVLALAAFIAAGAARADEPDAERPPIEDSEVQPAQYVQPIQQVPVWSGNVPGGELAAAVGAVPDPPTPTVRVQLRVAPATAPGKDVPYRIFVSNPSGADAHRVRVRMPTPAGAAGVTAIDPPAKNLDKPGAAPPELVWEFGTLAAGDKRTIELSLRPSPEARELSAKVYATFEHGQAATTRIDKPLLSVRKAAPKQAAGTDPLAVTVEVANTGKVPIHKVELVEDVSKGFEFAGDTTGERGAGDGQRVWEIGVLKPGERRTIGYRLTAKGGGELTAQSAVRSPDCPEGARAESRTKVLMPALELDLKGPASVGPGEAASYEAVVTNTGTMPLAEVLVTAEIPAECKVTKVTNGGQGTGDRVVWRGPDRQGGPLKPGQAYTVRFSLKGSGASGKRTVRVTAAAARDVEQSREAVTAFQGTALLQWSATADPPSVPAGGTGLLTIRVKNVGGEDARNTQLRLDLPPGVSVTQGTPARFQSAAGEFIFDRLTIPAGRDEMFTVTYQPTQPGTAWFRLRLAAEALGDQPLTREQQVQVTTGRTTSRGRERERD